MFKLMVKASPKEIRPFIKKGGTTQSTNDTFKKYFSCTHSFVDKPASNQINGIENQKLLSDWRIEKFTLKEKIPNGMEIIDMESKAIT